MAVSFKKLVIFRRILLWFNLVVVTFNAALFGVISHYLVDHQLSSSFIAHLNQLPENPNRIFFEASSAFLLLMLIMTVRHHFNFSQTLTNRLLLFEFILTLLVLLALRFSYNGVILLFFVDYFLAKRHTTAVQQLDSWVLMLLTILVTLSLAGPVSTTLTSSPQLSTYIAYLPARTRASIILVQNFLTTFNLLAFIVILMLYTIFLMKQENQIRMALIKSDQANQDLQHYVALSTHIAKDHERKRIARDLHDTVGHALTGISAGVNATIALLDLNPAAAKQQLQKVAKAVQTGIGDVRQSLTQLRPEALEKSTFKGALDKMLSDYAAISQMKITFNYRIAEPNFEKTTESVLFHVIEEAATNALRHGHAKRMTITFTETKTHYQLLISNDGVSAGSFQLGYGLTQMKERVAIIGGKISFDGSHGFEIKLTIPKGDLL